MFAQELSNPAAVSSEDFHLLGCILSREALRTTESSQLPAAYKINLKDLANFIGELDAFGHNIQSVILARDPKVELARVCEIRSLQGSYLAINNNGKLQIYRIEQSLKLIGETYRG